MTTQSENKEDLKPCPFCGKTPVLGHCSRDLVSSLPYFYFVTCCMAATALRPSKEEAIEAWNTRFDSSQERVRELERALVRACDMISAEYCSHITNHGNCRPGLKQCYISEFLDVLKVSNKLEGGG